MNDDDFMELGETGWVVKGNGLFNVNTKEYVEHVEEDSEDDTDTEED